jgi:laccase
MAASSALPCSLLIAAVMLLSSVIQAQGVTRNYDFNVSLPWLVHIAFQAAISTVA